MKLNKKSRVSLVGRIGCTHGKAVSININGTSFMFQHFVICAKNTVTGR